MLFGMLPQESVSTQNLPKKYLVSDFKRFRLIAVLQHEWDHQPEEQKVDK